MSVVGTCNRKHSTGRCDSAARGLVVRDRSLDNPEVREAVVRMLRHLLGSVGRSLTSDLVVGDQECYCVTLMVTHLQGYKQICTNMWVRVSDCNVRCPWWDTSLTVPPTSCSTSFSHLHICV